VKGPSRARGTGIAGTPPLPNRAGSQHRNTTPENEAAFRRELSLRLELVRQELDGLRRRAAAVPQPARDEYLELADALEGNVQRLESRVEKYPGASQGSWEAFRSGVERDGRDVEQTLARIVRSLRERYPLSRFPATPAARPERPSGS
jgi:hypothetical protein